MSNEQDKKQDIIKSFLEEKEKVTVLTKDKIQQLLSERVLGKFDNHTVFRGLTYDRELFPTVFRDTSGKIKNYKNLREYEDKLYSEYNRYSIQYLPYYESLADWLASAQHFGLKTRLVDWTYNPLIALFFAVNNEENNVDSYILSAGKEYTINEFLYFSETTSQSDEFTNKRMWQIRKNLKWIDTNFEFPSCCDFPKNDERCEDFYKNVRQKNKICFLETNNANPRIIAQEGIFQLCRFPTSDTCMSTVEQIKENLINEISNNIDRIYVIPQDVKSCFRSLLNDLNITTPKLFPDLENICRFINSQSLIEI